MELSQVIKEQASDLGFSLVGITTSDPLPHGDVFEAWLERGKQGEMSYLETARSRYSRAYPDRILPGCRSVLVLGVRYPAPLPVINLDDGMAAWHGKVAAYAWGDDYHEFLPARLRTLVKFIEAQVGHPVPNRWYTDTGPILERELAQRAGLGWIGKNTCLISPDHGSYFLLAEILLGLELETDPPFTADRCGTCSRCLQACPTGCILSDRTLDARRCISYLTIELKGLIPPELRPLMDGWVFGCDVCQQVCPWNRFSNSPVDPAFSHLFAQRHPELLVELALSTEEFSRKYHHSPLRRAKRRGYLRNIAVALGNLGNPDTVEPLVGVLDSDPEPLVRAHAAWALGQIGTGIVWKALARAATQEMDSQVMQAIKNSLVKSP